MFLSQPARTKGQLRHKQLRMDISLGWKARRLWKDEEKAIFFVHICPSITHKSRFLSQVRSPWNLCNLGSRTSSCLKPECSFRRRGGNGGQGAKFLPNSARKAQPKQRFCASCGFHQSLWTRYLRFLDTVNDSFTHKDLDVVSATTAVHRLARWWSKNEKATAEIVHRTLDVLVLISRNLADIFRFKAEDSQVVQPRHFAITAWAYATLFVVVPFSCTQRIWQVCSGPWQRPQSQDFLSLMASHWEIYSGDLLLFARCIGVCSLLLLVGPFSYYKVKSSWGKTWATSCGRFHRCVWRTTPSLKRWQAAQMFSVARSHLNTSQIFCGHSVGYMVKLACFARSVMQGPRLPSQASVIQDAGTCKSGLGIRKPKRSIMRGFSLL